MEGVRDHVRERVRERQERAGWINIGKGNEQRDGKPSSLPPPFSSIPGGGRAIGTTRFSLPDWLTQ